MNKMRMLEQCQRLQVMHAAETRLYLEEDNKWMINHNRGH